MVMVNVSVRYMCVIVGMFVYYFLSVFVIVCVVYCCELLLLG